jgi:hypothetical protein
MHIDNEIIRWIVIAILAFGYGVVVQHALKYDRYNLLVTLSIGAVGILIGYYIIPKGLNLSRYLYVGGIPLISSLIGSFIVPSILWILRGENDFNPVKMVKNRIGKPNKPPGNKSK